VTDDARDAIMRATYEALCAEGYSDLTAQAIADRTEKSKAALFYHYDSKEGLLAAFMDYLLEGYEHRVALLAEYPPAERLAAFVEWWFSPASDDPTGYHTAMLELRARAPYDERFREKLRASDAALRETLTDILEDGVETGAFQPHDSEAVADFLLATLDGARIRRFTLARDAYSDHVRAGVVEYLHNYVFSPDTTYPTDPVTFPADDRLTGSTDTGDGGGGAPSADEDAR